VNGKRHQYRSNNIQLLKFCVNADAIRRWRTNADARGDDHISPASICNGPTMQLHNTFDSIGQQTIRLKESITSFFVLSAI
jgi:hypothetical protein